MKNLTTNNRQEPQDLLSIKDMCAKYGFEYSYLYKWAIRKGAIKAYYRGLWKLSEQEVLAFIKLVTDKKLKQVRCA